MSAADRRKHLEEAVRRGGVIMTANGALTRQVPNTSTLARTPEEKDAARADIERRRRALAEEERLLGDELGEGAIPGSRGDEGGDELGEDFPGRAALEKAGFHLRSQLDGISRQELIALDDIGEKTADRILEALRK